MLSNVRQPQLSNIVGLRRKSKPAVDRERKHEATKQGIKVSQKNLHACLIEIGSRTKHNCRIFDNLQPFAARVPIR